MARKKIPGNAADNGGSASDFWQAMQSPETQFGVTAETKANYESKISALESKVSGLEEQLRLLREEHSVMFVAERTAKEKLERREQDAIDAYEQRNAAVARAEKSESMLAMLKPLALRLLGKD